MLADRMLRREGQVSMEFIRNLLVTDGSADFLRNPSDPQLQERFPVSMKHLSAMTEPMRANAFGADGRVLWSTDRSLVGRQDSDNSELREAMQGHVVGHSCQL